MTKNIVDKINEITDSKNDSELARKLSEISGITINRSRISSWRSKGFFGSTKALILLLIKQIKK